MGVDSFTRRPLYPMWRVSEPSGREAEWAPGPTGHGSEHRNLCPWQVSKPCRPARTQDWGIPVQNVHNALPLTLYRLNIPQHRHFIPTDGDSKFLRNDGSTYESAWRHNREARHRLIIITIIIIIIIIMISYLINDTV
jgi:hypothetical protein